MPMNGTTYVAPTWRNQGPPALDPAELQAMCDTIAGNQGKNLSQDSLIAALQTAVGGKGQIEVGSYVGTGTYGADNPNNITFPFVPKLVLMMTSYNMLSGDIRFNNFLGSSGLPWAIPSLLTTDYLPYRGMMNISPNQSKKTVIKKSSDGKSVLWYYAESDNGASYQYNSLNYTYVWIAFG